MNKKIIITIGVILVLAIIAGGFLVLQKTKKQEVVKNKQQVIQKEIIVKNDNNQDRKQDNKQNNKQEDNQEKVEELDFEEIDTSNWKEYCNQEYGFCVKYPENKYVINEESGMVHFYYRDGTARPGTQQTHYINVNISKQKNPQGVETLNELFRYAKDNLGVEVERITKETVIKTVGNTQFIVTKSYNSGKFYSILFVVMGKEEYYRISFGGYWNVIEENQYNMIMNMMESFKIIK